jgi:riboflavin-specific deaminase-like protein
VSSPGTGRIEAAVLSVLRARAAEAPPAVTLSWARTAAGAIAAPDGARTAVSGSESLALTHRLRSMHGAILVGIQTVLSDNPLLSVRLVDGPQPRPIVLDSRLRLPASARLLSRSDMMPWIFHVEGAEAASTELERAGARLFAVPRGPGGLDLAAVLAVLRGQGIASLMVEGGARVLQSFIAAALASQAVITTSPSLLEGIPGPGIPQFVATEKEPYGQDTVLWGRFTPR